MRIATHLFLILSLVILNASSSVAYKFGEVPLEDVIYAAQNSNQCEDLLSSNQLAALMLAPTWWEVSYLNTNRTPSPMALGRSDPGSGLHPDGHSGQDDPDRRAFWHTGIGAWQLDDIGVGTDMSIEKFNTKGSATAVAIEISKRYCRDQSYLYVFARWCGCGSNGKCGIDRDRCAQTFDEIYNSGGFPWVDKDSTTGRNGGSQIRNCRFAGQSSAFACAYVNPSLAEGYSEGWTTSPEGSPPLTKPFYVFEQPASDGDSSYEWRYWMDEDTGFGTDYAARRTYGIGAKVELGWTLDAGKKPEALCDVTMARGACPAAGNLSQLKYDGAALNVGDPAVIGSVIIRGTVSSNRGKPVRLELEVRKTSEPFSGVANYLGQFGSNGIRSKCVTGLPSGNYHWRARAVEENGAESPWIDFGSNPNFATDFTVTQSGTCVPCTVSMSLAVTDHLLIGEACEDPFLVKLAASSSNGNAPLSDVSLTALVSGVPAGTLTYIFYCNRSDSGGNITTDYAARYTGISTNPKTATGICDYSSPGTYTAKVIIQWGNQTTEDRSTIYVGASSIPVPEISTLSETSVTQASATFNATIHPKDSVTTFWFDYGTSTSVSQVSAPHSLAASTSPSAVSISQGGLLCGRQYFYRSRALNAGGLASPGSIISFTTAPCGSGGPQSVQLVVDSSFEAGNSAWWVASPAFYIDRSPEFPNPRTGRYYAFLSRSSGTAGHNLTGGLLSPMVRIPANTSAAELQFWYSITSEDTSTSANDKLEVYLVRSGNRLTLLTTLSNREQTGMTYKEKRLSIPSSHFGDDVQIFFRGTTNGSKLTLFRIDDVTLPATILASAPTASTDAADQVSSSSARLNMTVDPGGADTEIWFDLELGDSSPSDDTEHLSIGAGSGNRAVSISVFGLECGTKYYFRAHAENSHDRANGDIRNFTTAACSGSAPHADTDPAESITSNSAALTADVDANGLPTQAWFAWGDSRSLGQETTHLSVGSGSGSSDFAQTISGLECGTTYYFENHARNSAGEDDGVTIDFTTLPCSPSGSTPSVSTDEAGVFSRSVVVLNATINPNGASTRYYFDWGTILSYGQSTLDLNGGSGATAFPTSVTLDGLTCGTRYHFRAVAGNSFGTTYGNDREFSTLSCPSSGHPTFTRISDMTTPRYSPCAAKLHNGKVLVVGGTGTGHDDPLSSAELYDPATRTFAPTGSMIVARDRPSCVTLPDGRVLVAGGATARFVFTNSAEVYNPVTGTFTAVGNMTTVRGEGWHAFPVSGGAFLFGGTYEGNYGTATAAVDRFDGGSNSCSRVGTLSGARRDFTAQMLPDGTALLIGGVLRYDLPVSIPAELYNVSTNQPISIGQPIHAARVRSWSSALLPGGDVLVTSGAGFPSEVYRKATRSFEVLAGAPNLYADDFGSAISLSTGQVLLLGYGRAPGQGGRIGELFDPVGGVFTPLGPMAFPSECQGYTATALNDGSVLVTGGGTPSDCGGNGIPVAEIFDPNGL